MKVTARMHHLPDMAAQSLWRSILKDWEVSEYSSYVRILSVIPVVGVGSLFSFY